METIVIFMAIVGLVFTPTYFWLCRKHKEDMAILAADCSNRIQQIHRDLVIVCTEPDSIRALEIKTTVKIGVDVEKQIWEVVQNNEGLINNLNDNQNNNGT